MIKRYTMPKHQSRPKHLKELQRTSVSYRNYKWERILKETFRTVNRSAYKTKESLLKLLLYTTV